MHTSKSICATLMCACAFLSVVICPQVLAQGKLKTFDSLFGFKAGEDREKIKLVKSSLDDRYFRARKPFRKFRDVQLKYNDNGKLLGMTAVAWIDGMKKFDAMKKEVEACCKEFSVFGITFDEKQENDPAFSAYGRGPGIVGMHIQGTVENRYDERGRSKVGAKLSIEFSWDLAFKPINVKVANYSTKFGISRKEFIEKTFGMKFGGTITKYVELTQKDREHLSENNNKVFRNISSSICGFTGVLICLDNEDRMRIKGIGFSKWVDEKNMAVAKARFENVRAAFGKWLGIDSFETKENVKGQFIERNKNKIPYQQMSIVSTFEDNGLRVTIEDLAMENKGDRREGWSSHIEISFAHVTETEARMRKMILPKVSFENPATIVNAVEFFRKTAIEIDKKNNVPEGKCGFRFLLDMKGQRPGSLPNLSMEKLSLWDALRLVCSMANPRYKFEVQETDNGAAYIHITPSNK